MEFSMLCTLHSSVDYSLLRFIRLWWWKLENACRDAFFQFGQRQETCPGTHDGRPFQRGVVVRMGPNCCHEPKLVLPVPTLPPPAGAGPRMGTWSPNRGISRCRACRNFQNVHGRIERCRLQQILDGMSRFGQETICVFLLLLLLSLFMIILMAFVALDATFNSQVVGPT
jgi:hypothetical protein